jgi:hypothetical protein
MMGHIKTQTEAVMEIKDLKIRVPADLKDKLTDRAGRNDRTLNGEILQILKAVLDEHDREEAFWNTMLPNGQRLRHADDTTARYYIRRVHSGQALVVVDEHGSQKVVGLPESAAHG